MEVNKHNSRMKAFQNLIEALDFNKILPEQIFRGRWYNFIFCESDRLFSSEFINTIRNLLITENANVACMVNLDETISFKFDEIAAIFLDINTKEEDYTENLRSGGPSSGWFYHMHKYVCMSDIGEWCIYCEKENDIAVIGVRNEVYAKKLEPYFLALHAHSIIELIKGPKFLFPFSDLTTTWRGKLIRNYASIPAKLPDAT